MRIRRILLDQHLLVRLVLHPFRRHIRRSRRFQMRTCRDRTISALTGRKALLLLVLVALAMFSGNYAAQQANNSRRPGAPDEESRLEIAGELDLGVQFETAAFEHSFTLKNPTESPITITRLSSNCDCVRLTPTGTFVDPPGGSQLVQTTLSLRMVSGCQRMKGEAETTEIPIMASFCANGGREQNQVWTISCHLRPALRLSSSRLSFGLYSLSQAGAGHDLEIEAADHVRKVLASSKSSKWVVEIPRDFGEIRKARVTIHPRQPLAPGEFDDEITSPRMTRMADHFPIALSASRESLCRTSYVSRECFDLAVYRLILLPRTRLLGNRLQIDRSLSSL